MKENFETKFEIQEKWPKPEKNQSNFKGITFKIKLHRGNMHEKE